MNSTLPLEKNNANIENLAQKKQNRIEENASLLKTRFIGLSVLSALTTASCVFYPNITNAIRLAVPFLTRGLSLVIGGMTIYVAKIIYEKPDYSNPANIIKYKEAARKDPLHETFKKHQGFDLKLFAILDKATFDAKLNEELANMTTVEEMERHVYKIWNESNHFFKPFDGNFEEGLKKQMQNHLQKKCEHQTFEEIVEKQGFITAVEWELIPIDTIKRNEEKYKKGLNTHRIADPISYPRLHNELKKYNIT